MSTPKEQITYRGFTYRRLHKNPVKSKRKILENLKVYNNSPPTPNHILKTTEGYWAYLLDPKNKSDFPKKLKIDGITCEFYAGFTTAADAHECRRELRVQGKSTKQIFTGAGKGGYWGIYTIRLPPLSITGKWYGHKIPMQLYQNSIFETRKAAEEAKKALREKGEVVQIKPFEGWYALYHTEGLGKTLKVEVKYASTASLTPVKKHSAKRDGQRRALPVGKRVSKFGKVYYEYRENRGDGPAELKEKWGEERALAWAKNARAKQPKKNVVARLVAAGGKEWRSDSGAHRVYFNDLSGLYGLKTSRYGTGNISSATLRGSGISNSQARKIESAFVFAKVWYDVGTKAFGSKGLGDDDKAVIVTAIKKKAKI